MLVDVVHGSHDPVFEFLFRVDPNVAQDRAGQLGKERLDNVQPGAMLGREGEFEAPCGLFGEPGVGFLGNVGGVIVKDDLDRSMRCIGRVDNLEKFDELAAAMPVPDQGVNLPGQQVDAGQKADGAIRLYS
jgi:hypothetical protein